jgi:hypothetical protein
MGVAGSANTGGGGGGGSRSNSGTTALGGSGIIYLRYPTNFTITVGAGLTGTTTTLGIYKITTLTAGTGNVSWA